MNVIYSKMHVPGDISLLKTNVFNGFNSSSFKFPALQKCTNNQNHMRMQQNELMFPKHYYL